ncbi:hypothetical protein JB92DRAFT_3044319 [Gautieria morchelliformis]|nr:hypothetical protein JB92DRAFT_3044319 [Gautieria morchelliformis]
MAHGGSADDGVVRVALEEGAAPGGRRGSVASRTSWGGYGRCAKRIGARRPGI